MADLTTLLSKFLSDMYAGWIGTNISTGVRAKDGTAAAPSLAFASNPTDGFYLAAAHLITIPNSAGTLPKFTFATAANVFALSSDATLAWSSATSSTAAADTILARDAANTLALKNGTNAQTFREYGYVNGARATYSDLICTTKAVTLVGATTLTSGLIPAGAVVEHIATTVTTPITGATGYQVGDGTTATRYGDITGTIVGTASGSANYTADPRWWTNGAREITLTAKTSNFTGGVVQVMACYRTATGA